MKNYNDWAELAIARLRCYPVDLIMSMGSWEGNALGLIFEIERRSPVGLMYVKMEKAYFQAIKDNVMFKDLLIK